MRRSGQELPIGAAKQRALLAVLLLHAGEVVSTDRLIDALWGERPPNTAAKALQVYVSQLRKALGDEASGQPALATRAPGYSLEIPPDALDIMRFELLCEEGRGAGAQGRPEVATARLREALALWRGPALADLAFEPFAQPHILRLEEQRLAALEDRIDADLALGRHGALIGELESLVAEHPVREGLRGRLMLALYRAGRQADALAAFQAARHALVENLGIEPGRELRELHQAILRQDSALDLSATARLPAEQPAAEPASAVQPERELRKSVTAVSITATTSADGEGADPEASRRLTGRIRLLASAAVERHGGRLEVTGGDALTAVFGLPRVHEDDALRAARAAVELRDSLASSAAELAGPTTQLRFRIGISTGEVVTGGDTEPELRTVGEPLVRSSRLALAAADGDIVIDAATRQLLRDDVVFEAAPDASAARLLGVAEGARERSHDAPFVGRKRELATVREVWDGVRAERRCELVAIVGDAGVGKSRLAAEFLASIDALVVRGRCLPYGDGITYWPVVEVLKQLALLPDDEAAAAAIRSLLRETEVRASAEEIAWAFRKTLEQAAAERPLAVLFDDIQWGEETFRDLIEHVALLSSGAPILLLCLARPELTERHPAWPVTFRLEPLSDREAGDLMGERAPDRVRDRIARAAGGNPLFIEEMLAMAGDADGDVVVPPTLQALLAARLDQLEAAERSVLERAAVEGEIFHRGAVQALAPEETQVTPRLAALVRKQLIRPARPQLRGEDGFRFRHLLIRDTAYDALPKAVRADLHERFAAWLEAHGADLVELDELLGYHLEQAARYAAELRQPDSALRERAGEHLARAGRRAVSRGDGPAAAALLERALALTRPLRLDVHLELDLAEAQQTMHRRAALAEQTAERARAAGDRAGEALALVLAAHARSYFEPSVDELARLVHAALPLLEEAKDDAGLAWVWFALGGGVLNVSGRFEEWARAAEKALRHMRLAGHYPGASGGLPPALVLGPRPADEALESLDRIRLNPHPMTLLFRAELLAMLGRFDEAWALALPATERVRELRGNAYSTDKFLAEIAALAGDHATAAGHLRRWCDRLQKDGARALLSTSAPQLGRSLCMLRRYDEAEPLAELGRELGSEQDSATQMLWRQVQALVHANRGEHAEAERLAREAVEIGERTDALNWQGDALCDLAHVLKAAGRADEAAVALEQALDRYERKKNLAMVAQVRPRLEAIRAVV
ncbi:MAG: AAA family ATPase [Thermoleophilia bacterium]|nr:AAA family ATPase [Thermoleophilia bacterium]